MEKIKILIEKYENLRKKNKSIGIDLFNEGKVIASAIYSIQVKTYNEIIKDLKQIENGKTNQ